MKKPSQLDGYRAAEIAIKNVTDSAGKKRASRFSERMRRSVAFKEGYWQGLVFAECQLAMGQHPEHNATSIRKILRESGKAI